MKNKPNVAFFGGEPLGLPTLQALVAAYMAPSLVVCNPDRKAGRGKQLQSPAIKEWAQAHGIKVLQPVSYKEKDSLSALTENDWELFIVVAYNFILPSWLLRIPHKGVLNIHPSLLPKLRGASPIRSAILFDQPEAVGVTVMLMDELMDHGPIVAQNPIKTPWPITGPELDGILAKAGSDLLIETLPNFLNGSLSLVQQDHEAASYSKKFNKADSELSLDITNLPDGNAAHGLLCKINAFAGMTDTFFIDQGKRVKIKGATLDEIGRLQLTLVIPEGKKEMSFKDYLFYRSAM